MEAFDIFYPSQPLIPYIRHYWFLDAFVETRFPQRTIPVGCVSLVFHQGVRMFSSAADRLQPRSFISGLYPTYTDLSSSGQVRMIVVVFQPFGLNAFFKAPVSEFYGLDLSVEDMEDISFRELEDKLFSVLDSQSAVGLLNDFFTGKIGSFNDYDLRRITEVVQTLDRDETATVRSLSEVACLGEKQFKRIFSRYTGFNPKEFLRIVRFQRALYKLQWRPLLDFTTVAMECGYFDQSHMIRDFKSFSGYTPSEYTANCLPFSDYFSYR